MGEVWDKCLMEPNSFADYVYTAIENASHRYEFTHDFELEVYMYNIGSLYKVNIRLGNEKYIFTLNCSGESQLVYVK